LAIPERSQRVQWIRATKDNKQLAERYDAWAEEYDEDLLSYGYKLPALFMGLVVRHSPSPEGRLLDAGAGTGILGESLHLLGYQNLVTIDLSQGMLDVARNRGAYRELRQVTLGETLDFANDSFAATVAMGVLTLGHAPPESLDELVRVTRPGGPIIFSMINDEIVQHRFRAKQDLLELEGRWSLVEVTALLQILPYEEPDITHRVFVYRVT